MITSQIKIGEQYFDRISEQVVCVVEKMPYQPGRRADFKVRRSDNVFDFRQARDLGPCK